jgi:DUF4097 and DUF4098 domain-containing protein YvlB
MMCGAAVLILATLVGPARQPGDTRAPQTDQTVTVARGARLTVESFAGEVVVRAWDRDAVRVQARHGRRVKVNVRNTAAGVHLSAEDGGPGSIDYEISAPSWMPVKISGTFLFISVEGSASEVSAETTRGDIVVKGNAASVTAHSIEGEVIIEGARGRVTASSVNESLSISDATGDIAVESSNGDIHLAGIRSQSAEASTVNGDIVFDGTPADRGRYRFTTHNGDITTIVPESSNVTFTVRSYQGDFSPSIKLNGPPRQEVRQGRRTTYTLGNGSAEMELETFGGSIRVGTPATLKKPVRTKGDR